MSLICCEKAEGGVYNITAICSLVSHNDKEILVFFINF